MRRYIQGENDDCRIAVEEIKDSPLRGKDMRIALSSYGVMSYEHTSNIIVIFFLQ